MWNVDWIHLAQDKVQWRAAVKYGNEYSDSIEGVKLHQMCDY
jgi:hypothetical protein